MKPLRNRLDEFRRTRKGLNWQTLERDYGASWMLAGLANQDDLRETLAFKGGTSLRKCFGKDRFSEDLDFSTLVGCPTGAALESALQEACDRATKLARPYADLKFEAQRRKERAPHPENQDAFDVLIQLPWHTRKENFTRLKLEMSREETLLWIPEKRAILHPYGETIEVQSLVYAPEEIAAEKLRAILQQEQRRKEKWIRPRAKDFYDLWTFLIDKPSLTIEQKTQFLERLLLKCQAKGVEFTRFEDFFPPEIIDHARKNWKTSLGPLVDLLPLFDDVETALREYLETLFDDGQRQGPQHEKS